MASANWWWINKHKYCNTCHPEISLENSETSVSLVKNKNRWRYSERDSQPSPGLKFLCLGSEAKSHRVSQCSSAPIQAYKAAESDGGQAQSRKMSEVKSSTEVAACTCTAACVPGKTGCHVIHESVDDSDMFFKDILLQIRLLPASLSGFWWIWVSRAETKFRSDLNWSYANSLHYS